VRTTDKSASERRNRGLAPWQKRLKDAADSAVVTTRSVSLSGVSAVSAGVTSVVMIVAVVMTAEQTATTSVVMGNVVTSAAAASATKISAKPEFAV